MKLFLCMDYLSKYFAKIDCKWKMVTFRPPKSDQFVLMHTQYKTKFPLISAMKAQKLLEKDSTWYLASVFDTSIEQKLSPEDVPVVQDFLKVFQEELLGLPTVTEFDFAIDLVPGTAPISKTPYRMAPAELKELKTQLQELLDKGFVRPSFSP